MIQTQISYRNTKECKSCNDWKKLTEFTKSNQTASGYYSYCKPCANKKTLEYYYRNRTIALKRVRKYKNTEKGKEVQRKSLLKQFIVNPHKIQARAEIHKALMRGDIEKPTKCSKNNKLKNCKGRIEGHHPNYSKPLKVTWLCTSHHKQIHSKKPTHL